MRPLPPLCLVLLVSPAIAGAGGAEVSAGFLSALGVSDDGAGGLLVLFQHADDPRILARSFNGSLGPVQVAYAVPEGYEHRPPGPALPVQSGGGHVRALVRLERPDGPLGAEIRTVLLDKPPGADGWVAREMPEPLHACCWSPMAFAVGPDGRAHVLAVVDGQNTLLSETAGGWEATLVGGLSFGDVAIDPSGTPHACVTKGGNLVEWTPAGERVLIEGLPGDFFDCRLMFGDHGAMWGVGARMPLVGGSCLVNDLCAGAPDAGTLMLFQDDGMRRSISSTGIPYWSTPQIGEDASGRRFLVNYGVTQDEGRYHAYHVLGPRVRLATHLEGDPVALPLRNLETPHVAEVQWYEGGWPLVLRPLVAS